MRYFYSKRNKILQFYYKKIILANFLVLAEEVLLDGFWRGEGALVREGFLTVQWGGVGMSNLPLCHPYLKCGKNYLFSELVKRAPNLCNNKIRNEKKSEMSNYDLLFPPSLRKFINMHC